MKLLLTVLMLGVLLTSGAYADCTAKKAARNATMDATVGVSGRCDPDKLAKDAKEDLGDDVKDSVDVDRDKRHKKDKRKHKDKD
jgi:hypothetical protein